MWGVLCGGRLIVVLRFPEAFITPALRGGLRALTIHQKFIVPLMRKRVCKWGKESIGQPALGHNPQGPVALSSTVSTHCTPAEQRPPCGERKQASPRPLAFLADTHIQAGKYKEDIKENSTSKEVSNKDSGNKKHMVKLVIYLTGKCSRDDVENKVLGLGM